jgi:2-dehydro-3-deoxygalactonokinase
VIGVDWGTSRVRAYRLQGLDIVDRRESSDGVRTAEPGRFADLLRSLVGAWIADGERRILLTGTVGSRNGWKETTPRPCPVRLAELFTLVEAVPFPDACVRVVPGIADVDASGVPDVMRGEETELVGAGVDDGCICLPGSHSKWVTLERGTIVRFTTYLTGEAFSALGAHTFLAKLMGPEPPDLGPAFDDGVERSAQSGGLLHHLFGVRTLGLANRLATRDSASYLSGLLIGHEVRQAFAAPSRPVTVVGAANLGRLYARAIAVCGGHAVVGPDGAAARGLATIGARVEWTD